MKIPQLTKAKLALRPTISGPYEPGEHPCEVAWRLAQEVTGSRDACVSFRRLRGSDHLHQIFQTDLEDDLALSEHWGWQSLPEDFAWGTNS